VVAVDGKELRDAYTEEEKNDFAAQHFATGKVYRMMFGGGEVGTATVNKWGEGCSNIHAQVTAKASAPLGEEVNALATNSETIGKRASSRRVAMATERAAVLKLIKTIYAQHRTPPALISKIKTSGIVATDLDGDGESEFVGSAAVAARNKFERDLFLIAKRQGRTMRAEFVKFQAYQPPPEGFLHGIDFIDQLDLDGDGVAEIFTQQGGFDGYSYVIFKRVNGRWRQVFQTGGDAC